MLRVARKTVVVIPKRSDWTANSIDLHDDMVCYTDGSKLETTAGSTGPYHRQRSATVLPVKVQSLQHMKRRTRNSAVADKPRDEFVQMQWRG